jgi:hypothetical protein
MQVHEEDDGTNNAVYLCADSSVTVFTPVYVLLAAFVRCDVCFILANWRHTFVNIYVQSVLNGKCLWRFDAEGCI